MKYDFADAHLSFRVQDMLEDMRFLRSRWDTKALAEQLRVPLGSRISWSREGDPDEILDLLLAGIPVFKVKTPSKEIVYALPLEFIQDVEFGLMKKNKESIH